MIYWWSGDVIMVFWMVVHVQTVVWMCCIERLYGNMSWNNMIMLANIHLRCCGF